MVAEVRELPRRLSFWDAAAVTASDMVGSGIFFTTGWVAASIPSAGGVMWAWLAGGLLAICGALSYAEMAAAYPRAGGEYVYLREAYGPPVGFLTGWISLFVGFSAPLAIAALGLAEYLSYFFPALSINNEVLSAAGVSVSAATLCAMGVILGLGATHFFGMNMDRRVQTGLTAVKFLAIFSIVLLGLFFGHGQWSNLTAKAPEMSAITPAAFFAAVVPITFSYSGWNAASYLAGEVRRPGKNLPAALLAGTIFTIVLYMLINLVYFYALPAAEIAGTGAVAEKTASAMIGDRGAAWVSAMIALSLLGAINAMLFIGPRVLYAMARDGLFFRFAGEVGKKSEAPTGGVLALCLVSCGMVAVADLRKLLEFAGFVLVLSNFFAVAAVFVLRFKHPNIDRPYKAWGYPITPLLFSLFSLYLMYASFTYNLASTAAGLALVALGLPAYLLFKKFRKVATPPLAIGNTAPEPEPVRARAAN